MTSSEHFSLSQPSWEFLLSQLQPPLFVPVPEGNPVLFNPFFNAEHLASRSSLRNAQLKQHQTLIKPLQSTENSGRNQNRPQQPRGVCSAFVSSPQRPQPAERCLPLLIININPKIQGFVSLRPTGTRMFKPTPHNSAFAGLFTPADNPMEDKRGKIKP